MSYETSIAVMVRLGHDQLLDALRKWADEQERAAGFSQVHDGSYAANAWVIVGHVNHLDHDSLLAAIRGAVMDLAWDYCEPVGVTFISEDGPIWFQQLSEDGVWR